MRCVSCGVGETGIDNAATFSDVAQQYKSFGVTAGGIDPLAIMDSWSKLAVAAGKVPVGGNAPLMARTDDSHER